MLEPLYSWKLFSVATTILQIQTDVTNMIYEQKEKGKYVPSNTGVFDW